MHMRHAQRKHIIQSLTSLLYQLHTASFLLSPRLWPFICRLSTQFQFSRPREIDSQRSLRFWFILVLLANLQCFYHHIFKGAVEGRSIILDFVGVASKPSKTFLLSLDSVIVVLEFILITIAYETSLTLAMPSDTPDPLQPQNLPNTQPYSPLLGEDTSTKTSDSTSYEDENDYIIDLRLRILLQRLRHPPTPPPPQQRNLSEDLLPLPNTTSLQLSRSLNMLVRARAELRERAARAAGTAQTNRGGNREGRRERQPGEPSETETRRVPGGMGGEEL